MKKLTFIIAVLAAAFETRAQVAAVGVSVTEGYITEEIMGFVIATVETGSPAATAGVKVGQTLLSVDGLALQNMAYDEIIFLICGDNGSKVVLKVMDDDKIKTVTIKRTKDTKLLSADEREILTKIKEDTLGFDREAIAMSGKDKDGDAVADNQDECPEEAGKIQNQGCK